MPTPNTTTRAEAVQQVVSAMTGPLSFKEFAEQVLALAPTTAKNRTGAVRNTLPYRPTDAGILLLDDGATVVPTRLVMAGVRFRVYVSTAEAEAGWLKISKELIEIWWPRRAFESVEYLIQCRLLDEEGGELPVEPVTRHFSKVYNLDNTIYEIQVIGFDLPAWFLRHKIQAGDSILFTIVDWEQPCFRLEHEPAEQRQNVARRRRNAELAQALFDQLESSRKRHHDPKLVILAGHLRLTEPTGYPGDPIDRMMVIDGRLDRNYAGLNYQDPDSIFPMLVEDAIWPGEPPLEDDLPDESDAPELSPTQESQVYTIKAVLKHRKGLWRTVEILGGQTLYDLNVLLISLFNHDYDHLSGYWLRVRRGTTKQFREVDLGTVNPFDFDEGEANDIVIASLSLQVGDTLKWVHDFGDWIEHLLTVEAISDPEADMNPADYPRKVAQNQPKLRYCGVCKAEGRKTPATWICMECSDEEDRDVLVCEDCLEKHHLEHDADEIVY